MSGRQVKARRRAEGLSSEALRGQREFEAEVARLRMRKVAEADRPIVRRDGRRALASLALLILAALLVALALGGR
jgi:hypothetical protein